MKTNNCVKCIDCGDGVAISINFSNNIIPIIRTTPQRVIGVYHQLFLASFDDDSSHVVVDFGPFLGKSQVFELQPNEWKHLFDYLESFMSTQIDRLDNYSHCNV